MKSAFLRAIRMELLGLGEQLKESLAEVEESKTRLQRNERASPHIVATLRNTVFNSQLVRISDLSDPLIMDIVTFYSDLPVLLQIIEAMNQKSADLSRDDGSAQQAQRIRELFSIVITLSIKLTGFLNRISGLVKRLPDNT